jgi:hypothetical protein
MHSIGLHVGPAQFSLFLPVWLRIIHHPVIWTNITIPSQLHMMYFQSFFFSIQPSGADLMAREYVYATVVMLLGSIVLK